MHYYRLILVMLVLCPNLGLADSSPIILATGDSKHAPRQPQAFVSVDGTVDVVFATNDEIRLTTSHDQGATFQAATSSIRCPNLALGMRRGPRLVRTESAVIVTAIGGKQGKGRDGDLHLWRSTDNGASWSEAVFVNDVSDSAREGLHGMAAGPAGHVWCVWLDLRSGKSEIYTAHSSDHGQTWNGNVRAYRSPDGSVCECCHPSIMGGVAGQATVMFRNSLSGKRDMFLTRTEDGTTFANGRQLGQASWKLDACPMDGGMLASDGQAGLLTVWRRDNAVYATLGDGQTEQRLGEGQQPWAAWSAAGPIIVWTSRREGPLSLQRGLPGKIQQIAATARDPVVASHPQSDFAVICWEAKRGEMATVMSQVVVTTPINSQRE